MDISKTQNQPLTTLFKTHPTLESLFKKLFPKETPFKPTTPEKKIRATLITNLATQLVQLIPGEWPNKQQFAGVVAKNNFSLPFLVGWVEGAKNPASQKAAKKLIELTITHTETLVEVSNHPISESKRKLLKKFCSFGGPTNEARMLLLSTILTEKELSALIQSTEFGLKYPKQNQQFNSLMKEHITQQGRPANSFSELLQRFGSQGDSYAVGVGVLSQFAPNDWNQVAQLAAKEPEQAGPFFGYVIAQYRLTEFAIESNLELSKNLLSKQAMETYKDFPWKKFPLSYLVGEARWCSFPERRAIETRLNTLGEGLKKLSLNSSASEFAELFPQLKTKSASKEQLNLAQQIADTLALHELPEETQKRVRSLYTQYVARALTPPQLEALLARQVFEKKYEKESDALSSVLAELCQRL